MPARVVATTLAVAVLLTAACGQARAGNTQTLYTVTTGLMQKPGDVPRACSFVPLPLPPIGCGGVPISGLDLHSLPDAQTYRNGVVSAGTHRLVGTWEAGALHLTQPPVPASPTSVTPLPSCGQTAGDTEGPDALPQGRKLMDEEQMILQHGIVMLGFGVCQGVLFVEVAVADKDTVDYLTSRYAPVKVGGWLQPLV